LLADFAVNKYAITAGANAGGSISPSGIVSVEHGLGQAFAIAAAPGNRLKSVLVDGSEIPAAVAAGSYAFSNVTGDHSINATFIKRDTLETKAGPGGSFAPEKIVLDEGADTVFSVNPASGFKLATFTVDGADALAKLNGNKYTVKAVVGNHILAATFIQGYTMTGVAGPGGSVSPASAGVDKGADQAFTITADKDYRVKGVLDNGKEVIGSLLAGQYTLKGIDTAHTITATFIRQFPVSVEVSGNGSGKVDPTGTRMVDDQGSQAFKFAANPGSRLTGVLVDGVSQSNPGALAGYTFTPVAGKHVLSLVFSKVSYPVTAAVLSGLGTIAPASAQLDSLDGQVFAFAPAPGYRFHRLFDNDQLKDTVGATGQYPLSGVVSKHDIRIQFLRQYPVSADPTALGSILIPHPLLDSGRSDTITIHPNGGYRVDSVLDNGVRQKLSGTDYLGDQRLFISGNGEHKVSASFKRYYRLEAKVNEEKFGSIEPASAVMDSGLPYTFTLKAATGYRLSALTDNEAPAAAEGSEYILAGLADDHKIVATFSRFYTLTVDDSVLGVPTRTYVPRPVRICVSDAKEKSPVCHSAPFTLELDVDAEFSLEADPNVALTCRILDCVPDSYPWRGWAQATPAGGVVPLDQPNPTKTMALKRNIRIVAVYASKEIIKTGTVIPITDLPLEKTQF
jgi:hypothetical protein